MKMILLSLLGFGSVPLSLAQSNQYTSEALEQSFAAADLVSSIPIYGVFGAGLLGLTILLRRRNRKFFRR